MMHKLRKASKLSGISASIIFSIFLSFLIPSYFAQQCYIFW